jgi:phage tail-like protein
MTAVRSPPYRFATEAQWKACVTAALAEDLLLGAEGGEVMEGFTGPANRLAAAPGGACFRAARDGTVSSGPCAGPKLGTVARMVADSASLRVLAGGGIVRLDPDSLQTLERDDAEGVRDIALDGREGLWRLRADRVESPRGSVSAEGADRIAFTDGTLAMLDSERAELRLRRDREEPVAVDLASYAPPGSRFEPSDLHAGGRAFLVEGQWVEGAAGPAPGFLLLDRDGSLMARGRWDSPPEAATVGPGGIVAAFSGPPARLRLYAGSLGSGRRWLTPGLEADTLAGSWLRADVLAILPEGATLTLRWASSRDESLLVTADAIAADPHRPPVARLAELRSLLALDDPETKAVTYVGAATDGPPRQERFSFPLHDADGHLLWAEVSAHRNAAEIAPSVQQLAILHDTPSLMDNLPAIYRAPNGDGDGTLRRLVDVLEAGTQEIDERIGRLADRLSAERAQAHGLPELAALLGLPFDQRLSEAMQRALIGAAAPILAGRGTRAGIEAVLRALFGRRGFRLVDSTERTMKLALGHGRLPARLSGPSSRVPQLNARLVLNRTALCPEAKRIAASPSPEILVFIPASGTERRRYAAAVEQLLASMIPAGARLRIRWTQKAAEGRRAVPGTLAIVAERPPLRLGEGQALGRVTIAGDRRPRLRAGGVPMGHRLV